MAGIDPDRALHDAANALMAQDALAAARGLYDFCVWRISGGFGNFEMDMRAKQLGDGLINLLESTK